MLFLHLKVDSARLFFSPRLLNLVSFCTWRGKETPLTLCTVNTHLQAVEERISSRNTLCKHSAKSLDLHILNQWGLGKTKGGGFYPDCSLSKFLGGVQLFMFSLRKNVLKVWCWVVLYFQKNPGVGVLAYGRVVEAFELSPESAPRSSSGSHQGHCNHPKELGLGLKERGPNDVKNINLLHRNRNLTAHSWGQMDNLSYFRYQWNFCCFRDLPSLIGPTYAIHMYLEMHWK